MTDLEIFKNIVTEYRENCKCPASMILELLDKIDMSNEEAAIILHYTGRGFHSINSKIFHGEDLNLEEIKSVKLLDSVLSKIESCPNKIVYRYSVNGYSETEELDFFNKNIGNLIEIPFYLSTTYDENGWDPSLVKWKIETTKRSKGRDISFLSNTKDENEVLFLRDSTFYVSSVCFKTQTVHLKEVECDKSAKKSDCIRFNYQNLSQ